MIMNATVLRVRKDSLLVRDLKTNQEVLVNHSGGQCFRIGDCVRIQYNGIMTRSIPPQITAIKIIRLPFCKFFKRIF